MAGKRVVIDIDGTGKITVAYDGFIGNSCFEEASRIKHELAALGLDMEVTKVDPHRDEVETRRLENQADVRS